MHRSTQEKVESRLSSRQPWQEPMILIERSLSANAQGPGPHEGPVFGPLSTSRLPLDECISYKPGSAEAPGLDQRQSVQTKDGEWA